MPIVGEVRRGKEIGSKSRHQKYIWHACGGCGKQRWVAFLKGKPRNLLCCSCANRLISWKRGRMKQDGYIKVSLNPSDFFYPMTDKKGGVLEHRLIMAKHLNRCLLPWEVVHHKNGVRNDNRLENLELLPDKKWHLVDTATRAYIKRLEVELERFKQLLAEGKLAYVDRTAELPEGVFDYEQHKRIFKEAGWVKEVKDGS